MTPTVVPVDTAAVLGEHPVWDVDARSFGWVDMLSGTMRRTSVDGDNGSRSTPFPWIGAAMTTTSGAELLVTRRGIALWDGFTTPAVEGLVPDGMRLNDAACDALGRVWIGSTSTAGVPSAGQLLLWRPGEGARTVASGLGLPNGIAWSPEDDLMYLADSHLGIVLRASVDPRSGNPSDFTPFLAIDRGVPDGLCVDEGGDLWVAVWDGARIERWSAGGQLVETVPFPVSRVASCALDADGRLFATTARHGLSADALRAQPDAGRPFLVEVDAVGLPPRRVVA